MLCAKVRRRTGLIYGRWPTTATRRCPCSGPSWNSVPNNWPCAQFIPYTTATQSVPSTTFSGRSAGLMMLETKNEFSRFAGEPTISISSRSTGTKASRASPADTISCFRFGAGSGTPTAIPGKSFGPSIQTGKAPSLSRGACGRCTEPRNVPPKTIVPIITPGRSSIPIHNLTNRDMEFSRYMRMKKIRTGPASRRSPIVDQRPPTLMGKAGSWPCRFGIANEWVITRSGRSFRRYRGGNGQTDYRTTGTRRVWRATVPPSKPERTISFHSTFTNEPLNPPNFIPFRGLQSQTKTAQNGPPRYPSISAAIPVSAPC